QAIPISTIAYRLVIGSSSLRVRLHRGCRGMRSGLPGGIPDKRLPASPGATPVEAGFISPPPPIPMATDGEDGGGGGWVPHFGAAASLCFAAIMGTASPSLATHFSIPFSILTYRQPCRTRIKALLS